MRYEIVDDILIIYIGAFITGNRTLVFGDY